MPGWPPARVGTVLAESGAAVVVADAAGQQVQELALRAVVQAEDHDPGAVVEIDHHHGQGGEEGRRHRLVDHERLTGDGELALIDARRAHSAAPSCAVDIPRLRALLRFSRCLLSAQNWSARLPDEQGY